MLRIVICVMLACRPLFIVLIATVSSARPTSPPPPETADFNAVLQERDALIRGAILTDRSAGRSVVTAPDLGITSLHAFAVMNGGVDPISSDCLCLRPGNLALQGRGELRRSSSEVSTAEPSTLLRGAADVTAPGREASGYGFQAMGSEQLESAYAGTLAPGMRGRAFGILASSEYTPAQVQSELSMGPYESSASVLEADASRTIGPSARPNGNIAGMGWAGGTPLIAGVAGDAAAVLAAQSNDPTGGRGIGTDASAQPGNGEERFLLLAKTSPLTGLPASKGFDDIAAAPRPASVGTSERAAVTAGMNGGNPLLRNTMRFYEAMAEGRGGSDASSAASGPASPAAPSAMPTFWPALASGAGPGSALALENKRLDLPGGERFALYSSPAQDEPVATADGAGGSGNQKEDLAAISALANGADLTGVVGTAGTSEELVLTTQAAANTSQSPVPEPATIVLLAVGIAAIAFSKVNLPAK